METQKKFIEFEVGKIYCSGGEWFRCVKRELSGVPNLYNATFVSNVFPYEFTVRLNRLEGWECFGGEKYVASFCGKEPRTIEFEYGILEWIHMYVPLYDANTRIINGRMSAVGYSLCKSETSGRWIVKSDANISYFNSEMFGEFKTVEDAFMKIYEMVESEYKSKNK